MAAAAGLFGERHEMIADFRLPIADWPNVSRRFAWLTLVVLSSHWASAGEAAIGTAAIGTRQSSIGNPPSVGMEGRVEVILPGTALEARPVEHQSRLIVRVAE